MPTNKTQWTTPQLIVLARGTPQESVLFACKTQNPGTPATTGPTDRVVQDRCAAGEDYANCSNCQARAQSDT